MHVNVQGWPLIQARTPLTALSILVRGEGRAGDISGVCRISGPADGDEIVCSGPGSLPFRPGVLDCVLVLLRAGVLQGPSISFLCDLVALLHERGLALIIYPGHLSTAFITSIQRELLPLNMGVTSVRGITPETRSHCTARVLEAEAQLRKSSAANGGGESFVIVQVQKMARPVTAECYQDYISKLVARSISYVQPPEPPYGQSPADLEFFRPLVPDSCFAHLANFYEWEEVYPELRLLLDQFDVIRDEANAVGGWTPWPEYHFREGGGSDWRVFPFLHTFPALDESRSSWIEATCKRCPETVKLLKRIPRLRTALLSRLGPNTKLSAHTGWEDLANHVLRVHLTIKTPRPERVCGVWVEGEVRHHREKEFIVFDDSKIHKAFNLHDSESRIVLILDLLRPESVPVGVAVGGHTPELDSFIDLFG